MIEGIDQMKQGIDPFGRTLFKPDSWFAKIDYINHLILFNNVIISVLSDKEGGKTSFRTLLQNNLDLQIKSYATTVEPSCSKAELLQAIAMHLNFAYHGDLTLDFIVSHINESKAHMLIIIDDAQYLPDDFLLETIEAINKQSDFGFFHICFISDHSIVDKLNVLSAKPLNDLIHIVELSSLNEHETRNYVLQRLMENKLIKKTPTEQQFKQFYQLTKGNLSKINHKWESFVSNCSKTGVKKIYFVQYAAILITAVFVLKASFWHFRTVPTNVTSNLTDKTLAISYIEGIPEPVQESKLAPIPLPLLGLNSVGESSVNPLDTENLVSSIPVWYEKEETSLDSSNPFVQQEIDKEEQNLTVAIIDKVIVIPKLKPQKIDKSLSDRYTIQLLASHNKKDLQYYKHQHPGLLNTSIKHFTNEKGPWYVLILGGYKNKTQAQLRIKALSNEFAHLKPWVRSMSDLENVA